MSRTVELAYDFIYAAIASGRLRPGDHVPEEMIAAELRVSRTPVREAIRRLETEGLVVITRNSGADIVLFGPEDIIETFRLRSMLEGYAAERAATRIDAHAIAELDGLVARMSNLRASTDLLSATRINAAFHLRIAEAANSSRLYALIRGLVHTPLALMHRNGWAAQLDGARGFDEHARIVEALRNRDPDLARALMQTHILGARPKVEDEAGARQAERTARITALGR